LGTPLVGKIPGPAIHKFPISWVWPKLSVTESPAFLPIGGQAKWVKERLENDNSVFYSAAACCAVPSVPATGVPGAAGGTGGGA